jgi:tetratricopeptide (TPR) repeat protein/tRNA A-37 threonylcarbamoyl transferase component Bud32
MRPRAGQPQSEINSDRWQVQEKLVLEFEDAWRAGRRPAIADHLPTEEPARGAVLVELVHAELEFRLRAGEPVRVETYLERYPELTERAQVVVELIAAEEAFRRKTEPTLTAGEFLHRFPQYRPELEQRFASGERSTVVQAGPAGAEDASRNANAAGRYRPLRLHAHGGLGEVFLARDETLHRDVALKRIRAERAGDPESRRRFLLEAEVTGRLEHPGIVPVHDLVQDESGQPCYAMRFVQGETLKDAIERFHREDAPGRDPGERSLALRHLLARFIAVCNAVEYAHSRGILHRDLKPSNIMVGKYGETLVLDWGLAKPFDRDEEIRRAGEETLTPMSVEDETCTQLGQALGTPAFMSPEQAGGHWTILGPRSDIYSLGATLYVILTGEAPFSSRGFESLLHEIQQGRFPPPGKLKKEIPAALEAICLKAMALRPEDRYGSAQALAADLEHWLADEPVTARAEGWGTRVNRWARRHRAVVASAAVALFLTAIGAVLGLSLWNSAENKRRQEAVEHRLDLERTARANETLGIGEVQAGRFANAEKIFREAADRLESDVNQSDLMKQIRDRQDRAFQLTEFYRLAQLGERYMTHDRDQQGEAAFEKCMAVLRIFEHDDWWNHLPADELTSGQLDRLQRDIHLRLILLGGIRGRKGLMNFGNSAVAAQGCKSGLEACLAAQRYRRTYAGYLGEVWCRAGLGQVEKLPAPRELSGATDHYLVGILNLWTSQLANDPISRFVLGQAQGVWAVLDSKTPLATAERHLRMAATLEPEHYWTYYWLGETLMAARKYDVAELAYATCIGLHPDYCDGYVKRAFAILAQIREVTDGQRRQLLFAKALVDLDAAVKAEPSTYYVYTYRGLAYSRMREYEKAVADYTRAIECASQEGTDDPHFYFIYDSRAEAYRNLGQLEKAMADFDAALRLFPKDIKGARFNNAVCYEGRAKTHLARGDYEHAIADYSEAIRRAPAPTPYTAQVDLPSAYQQRGFAYAARGQWDGAEADARKALSLNKKNADAWSLAGHLRLQAGDIAGYRKVCADALANLAETPDAESASKVAWLCVLAPDALPDLTKCVRLAEKVTPGQTNSPHTVGAALYRSGKYAAAVKSLSDAEQAPQTNDGASAWFFLAMAHQRLGQSAEAKDYLVKATQWFESATASLPWDRQVGVQLLKHEAQALISANLR